MSDYITYKPEEGFLKELHWEIWSRLPTDLFKFEGAVSRGGNSAMRVQSEGHYIWVTPQVTAAFNAKHQGPFNALGRRHENKLEFVVVRATKAENAVANTEAMNTILAKMNHPPKKKKRHKP